MNLSNKAEVTFIKCVFPVPGPNRAVLELDGSSFLQPDSENQEISRLFQIELTIRSGTDAELQPCGSGSQDGTLGDHLCRKGNTGEQAVLNLNSTVKSS